MSWWTESTTTPKRKSLFYVKISSKFFLPFVKTCSKPSANVETKEFKLINHYIKYPGLVKWNPITITMVDMNGSSAVNTIDTATVLWRMLKHSGYNFPDMAKGVMSHNGGVSELTTTEKESMLAAGFGAGLTGKWNAKSGGMTIYQVNPEGTTVEQWTLKNPIIKSIKWGDLSYEADEPVEYTLEVDYDWAELEHNPSGTQSIGTVYQNFMKGLISQEDAVAADNTRKEAAAQAANERGLAAFKRDQKTAGGSASIQYDSSNFGSNPLGGSPLIQEVYLYNLQDQAANEITQAQADADNPVLSEEFDREPINNEIFPGTPEE